MLDWFDKWLPILFGCHQRADRSFHFHGRQFPICARCTGELAGILASGLTFALWHPGWKPALLLLVPLVLDGGLQALTPYESGNGRRLVTGTLFGYGLTCLFFLSSLWVLAIGDGIWDRLDGQIGKLVFVRNASSIGIGSRSSMKEIAKRPRMGILLLLAGCALFIGALGFVFFRPVGIADGQDGHFQRGHPVFPPMECI